jgi:hypothetical protein
MHILYIPPLSMCFEPQEYNSFLTFFNTSILYDKILLHFMLDLWILSDLSINSYQIHFERVMQFIQNFYLVFRNHIKGEVIITKKDKIWVIGDQRVDREWTVVGGF